ncbi:MAG TPA: hypothetical protein VHG53_00465 [Candidatus Limnocylindria bacterium]|nr:hypothetical protein [Candidatus Limnocylindria bacterium]
MGTRYEDQPPEQWAGAESLDPTPVWKQYLIVATSVLLALALVVVVAYNALAVEFATPPAVVAGGRVVLALADVPRVGAAPTRYGPPLVDVAHSFYLLQPKKGEFLAVLASALPSAPPNHAVGFSVSDAPGGPPANFDRYLVSVEGTKVVVNTSRVISGTQVVPAPSDPTFR